VVGAIHELPLPQVLRIETIAYHTCIQHRRKMLTSTQNPLVKQIKKLQGAKERRETQLFLIEGTHLIEAACAVNYPLMTLCCGDRAAISFPTATNSRQLNPRPLHYSRSW
jgi:hypothetical protein